MNSVVNVKNGPIEIGSVLMQRHSSRALSNGSIIQLINAAVTVTGYLNPCRIHRCSATSVISIIGAVSVVDIEGIRLLPINDQSF